MVASVRPKISSTSHPLHTGFSTGGGAVGTGATLAGAKGSGTPGTGACDSALTSGCGSNCGLSEEDKTNSLSKTWPRYSVPGTRYWVLGTSSRSQNIPLAPAPYTTSSPAPPSPASPVPLCVRLLPRPRGQDQ